MVINTIPDWMQGAEWLESSDAKSIKMYLMELARDPKGSGWAIYLSAILSKDSTLASATELGTRMLEGTYQVDPEGGEGAE